MVATALAIACSSEPVESLPASCTARDQNAYVYQILRHYYLWADQLPSVSPSEFGSPEELVAELIDGELDPWTQFARVPQEPQAGFGYRLQKWGDELWVVWSHPASDAHAAGLRRGAQVLAIGGVPAGTLDPSVSIGDLGESVEHTFIDGVGDAHTITLARNFPFEITVGDANSTVVDDLVVGYLLLFNLGISGATELPDAIARFASAGVKHLIVDARYSGGGRVEIAQLLGSLLAGRVARGKPLMIQRYNGMHPELDRSLNVFEHSAALNLFRLIIIVGSGTGSATEHVIHGLRPLMDVTLIGGPSAGKGVGADIWSFCGKTFAPVTFAVTNAVGQSIPRDGLQPDCWKEDDLRQDLGQPLDPAYAAALRLFAGDDPACD